MAAISRHGRKQRRSDGCPIVICMLRSDFRQTLTIIEELKISIMYAAARHSWTQSAGQFTILIVSTGIKEWTGHLCLWQKNGISHSIFADHYRSSLRSSAVRNLFRVGLCRGDTVSAGSKILLRKRMVFRQPGQGRL